MKRTLDNDDKEVQQLPNIYSDIVRRHPTADNNSDMRTRIKDLNSRWEALNGTVQETMKNVNIL